MDRACRPRPRPALARGEPRRLARGAGRDAADHPRLVRPAGDPVAASSTSSSSRSSRRRWPPASWRWRAAASSLAGAPPVIGAIVAAPGWVDPPRPRRDRRRGGRPAVRERHPRAAARRRGGRVVDRWRWPAWCGRDGPRRRTGKAAQPPAVVQIPGRDGRGDHAARPASRRPPVARRAGSAPSSLIGSLLVAGAVVAARPAGGARISVLDVGQGDAILVEGSRGGRLLIDGGPDPDRLLVALDRADPAVGPPDRRGHPEPSARGPRRRPRPPARALPRRPRVRAGDARTGSRLRGVGPTARCRGRSGPPGPRGRGPPRPSTRSACASSGRSAARCPLEPPDGGTGINNVSVVLLGEIGPSRVLLMGDVEEGIDPSLLAEGLPHVDLLKVAHHGSRTATTQAFVEATRPKVAVASAGAGNPYGHPAKATLDRLAAAGARVLRTDRDGTVVVGFEAGGMTVRTEGAATADVATDPERRRVARYRRPRWASSVRPLRARTPIAAWRSCARSRSPGWSPTAGRTRGRAGRRPGPTARPRRIPAARASSGTIETMTVPGRVEAASLLLSLDPPPWFVRHARAVAEVAGWLAARIEARGVDRRSPAGRVGGAAPRRRQGAPGRRSCARPPPRRRLGGLADPGRSPGAGPAGGGHPVTRLLDGERLPALGGVRDRARSGSSPTRTSARGSASKRWTRGSPRGVAAIRGSTSTAASAGPTPTCGPSGRAPTGSSRTSVARPGVAAGRGRRLAWTGAGRSRAATRDVGTVDDHRPARVLLGRRRAVRRARARPVRGRSRRRDRRRRWTAGSLRGNRNMAPGASWPSSTSGSRRRSCSGAGRWRSSSTRARSSVKGEDRDAFLAAIGARRAGQRAGDPRRERVRRQGPGTEAARRCRRRGRRHGPPVQVAPKEGALAGWIEAEARERGLHARAGRREGARRTGRWVRPRGRRRAQPADPDRLDGARQARPLPGRRRRSRPDDVRALVAEAVPGSVWAFTDAVGERRVERALGCARPAARDDAGAGPAGRPPPAVRELIETGDRLRLGRAIARCRQGDGDQPASSGWRSSATRQSCGPRPS